MDLEVRRRELRLRAPRERGPGSLRADPKTATPRRRPPRQDAGRRGHPWIRPGSPPGVRSRDRGRRCRDLLPVHRPVAIRLRVTSRVGPGFCSDPVRDPRGQPRGSFRSELSALGLPAFRVATPALLLVPVLELRRGAEIAAELLALLPDVLFVALATAMFAGHGISFPSPRERASRLPRGPRKPPESEGIRESPCGETAPAPGPRRPD
jgi:hypothetical protein